MTRLDSRRMLEARMAHTSARQCVVVLTFPTAEVAEAWDDAFDSEGVAALTSAVECTSGRPELESLR